MIAGADPQAGAGLVPHDSARLWEVVALRALPPALEALWPVLPGDVRRDGAGEPVLLHFAPDRWLLTDAPVVEPAMASVAQFGSAVEVTGKWQGYRITGAGAAGLLATALDVEAVLHGRQCAAVTLWDCPAIIVRVPGGCLAWVLASYGAHLRALTGTLVA